ncbi:hypothetical protein T484DRAFT_1761426 [Baffinella frigidus]|nr:hypothetical protein T484DRAFT_1761426 [Cryptophyta sp. CCMP2293]
MRGRAGLTGVLILAVLARGAVGGCTLRLRGGWAGVKEGGQGGRLKHGVEKEWKGRKPWIKYKTLTHFEARKQLWDKKAR